MKLMPIAREDIAIFQKTIFDWWTTNKRDLPWRHTRDPYRILISEVMLQQTQVSRVLTKYQEFLDAFPSVHELASAPASRVLTVWRGMGYNRRALYLKRTAETVVHDYKGKFPDSESLLLKLPGLGKYTARAIMVFAFEKNVGMVDTNIRHILTHFLFNGKSQKEKVIEEVADLVVPHGRSWEWHQALMDYGALAMTKEKKKMGLTKRQSLFKDSRRYYRGRIVDVLRVGPHKKARLIADFSKQYGKDAMFMEEIIEGLTDDGLVTIRGSIVSLPE
jgi:A/G-specific adenine glycosylase